jgi:LysM repeat protein
MKKPRGRFGRIAFSVFGLITIAIMLGICVFIFLLARNREQTRRQFEAPVVYLTEPNNGDSVPNGGSLAVSASALGQTPIRSVELWLDGDKLDTRLSDTTEGLSPFFVIFSLPISEGSHTLFVRAVNVRGIIGTSLPVEVFGKKGAGEPFQPVLVNPDQTLADIAISNGTDLEKLQQLNPGLDGQNPVPGSFIKLPPASAPQGGNPIQLPDAPPLKVIEPGLLEGVTNWLNPFLVQPPLAPSDLVVQVADCKVALRWNDNAEDEQSYEVWVSGGGVLPHTIYKLNPANGGQVWFEFPAPQPGVLTFWVEAVNTFGSQPSNIVEASIDDQCPSNIATQLGIELLEINSSAGYEKAYCYVSIEGAPHVRIPAKPTSFFQVQNGQTNLSSWDVSDRQYVISLPADGAVEMAGECWGWSAGFLDKIGPFSGVFPVETWDGAPLTLQAGAMQLIFSVQPFNETGQAGTKTTYANNDPSIPVPYNLRIEESGTEILGDYEQWMQWDWNGDPKAIDGYMVYLDGLPYKMINNGGQKAIWSLLPYGCGKHVRWEVAAVAGQGQSSLSAPLEYDLPTCALFAIVQFESITVQKVYNGVGLLPGMGWGACDTIGASFGIYVNNYHQLAGRWYADLFSGPGDYPLTCGIYTFDKLFRYFPKYQSAAQPDTMRVMLKGDNPSITFATRFMYWNTWGEPTNFAMANQTLSMPYEQWKSYKNTFGMRTTSGDVEAYVRINVWTEANK